MTKLTYKSSMLHPLCFLLQKQPDNGHYNFKLAKIFASINYQEKAVLREVYERIIGFQFQQLRDTLREIV